MRALLVLLIVFNCNLAFSKDLYMTVYRDFGQDENAEILLHYKKDAPFDIRVLKPKNLKEFISSQIDLRRSWKTPKLETNPANDLIRGINKSSLNLGWIRGVLSSKVRKENKKYGGAHFKTSTIPFRLGPDRLISSPKGFDVINNFIFSPDKTDNYSLFDVPGYNDYEVYRYDNRERPISIPKLSPGFYVVQVVQGNTEGQVVLVINNIVANLQQSSNVAYVRATDRKGYPLKNADVLIRSLTGEWISDGTTDDNGVYKFDPGINNELITVVQKKGYGTAIVDSEYYSTVTSSENVYLYTDRPMYKNGDDVFFKGIVRKDEGGISSLFDVAEKVEVNLVDVDNNSVVESQNFTVNEFGSFSGQFKLADDSKLSGGLYRVEASIKDKPFIGEFRIKDYVKPLIYVDGNPTKEILRPGDNLSFKFEIKNYAGGNAAGGSFKWELLRVKSEEPQWIEDLGLSESGNEKTYWHDPTKDVDAALPEVVGRSNNYSKCNDDGVCQIDLEVPFDTPSNDKFDYKYILKITASDGDRNFTSKSYSFVDQKAEHILQVRTSHVYAMIGADSWLNIRTVTPKGNVYPNATGEVRWQFKAYGEPSIPLDSQKIEMGQFGRIKVAIPTDKAGLLTAIIDVADKSGASRTVTKSIYVVSPDDGVRFAEVNSLELLSRRDYYSVGEEVKVLALLPQGWGAEGSNHGNLYITISSKNILDHFVQKVDGLTAWVKFDVTKQFQNVAYVTMAYSHPKKGWVIRTIRLNIPPKNKLLSVKVEAKNPEISPGDEQEIKVTVKDNDKKPVRAELSISVVDNSVMSLLPELRPYIFDFFYPSPPFNVMNFFSSDFQGYGYGEDVSRYAALFNSNHFVSLTKSDEKKLNEKDTAYFSGDVKTNKNGEATVRFKMPGNQTLWDVIVVASDKDGRFGESKNGFKSQMPVFLKFGYPPFVRSSDKFDFTTGLNKSSKKSQYKINLTLEGDGILSVENNNIFNGKVKESITKSNKVVSSDKGGQAKLNVKLSLDGKPASTSFEKTVDVIANEMSVMQSYVLKKGEGSFDFSDKLIDYSQEVSINLYRGISGTVLNASHWMVGYPHGCIEQLINSTVPNIAIYSAFKSAVSKNYGKINFQKNYNETPFWNVLRENFFTVKSFLLNARRTNYIADRIDSAVLEKAKKYSEEGLKKINSYRYKNNGYSWFSSGSYSDLKMSIYVLLSTVVSEDRNLLLSLKTREVYNEIKNQVETATPEGIALKFVVSHLKKLGIIFGDSSNYIPALKLQMKYLEKNFSLLEASLWLQAVSNFGLEKSNDLEAAVSSFAKQIKRSIFNKDINSIEKLSNNSHKFRYPGGRNSIVSFALKALHSIDELDESEEIIGVRYLLSTFKRSHFGSTIDTSMVLMNLKWILEKEFTLSNTWKIPIVMVDGVDITNDIIQKNSFNGVKLILPKDAIKGKRVTINSDSLDAFLHRTIDYRDMVPYDDIKPYTSGYKIQRGIYQLDETSGRRKKSDKFQKGDLVSFDVNISRHGHSFDYQSYSDYFYVELDIPAGFVPLEEDDLYTVSPYGIDLGRKVYSKRIFNQGKIIWYVDASRIGDLKYKLGIVARAAFSGEFSSGVARVVDFYNEDIQANTRSQRISISR